MKGEKQVIQGRISILVFSLIVCTFANEAQFIAVMIINTCHFSGKE